MKKYLLILIGFYLLPVQCIAQNGFTFHAFPPSYSLAQLRFKNDLKIDAQNNLWVAFRDIGLGKFDGSNWTMYDTANSNIPSNLVTSISFDSMNNLWVGTNNGLAKFNGTVWTTFDTLNSGLPHNYVYTVKSIGSQIYCGTKAGLVNINGTSWTIYNTQNSGIASDSITGLNTGVNGELWVGTFNRGISKFFTNSWTTFNSSNSSLTPGMVSKLVVDNNNSVWTSTQNNRLFKISGPTFYDFNSDLYNGVITPVYSNGSLTTNLSGSTFFPQYFQNKFSINEIKGNDIEISGFSFPFQIAPSGALSPQFVSDLNDILWLSYLIDSNGIYGMLSFDKSQSATLPFLFTNENSKFLDINGVKASILNRGDMHWDLSNNKYEVPKGKGIHSVFASALWMGGIDNGAQLHMAAQTYRQTGSDYWPGPIDTVTGASDSVTAMLYDKIWKVNRSTLEDFKIHFSNGSVANGTWIVPDEIMTWPAQGAGNITRDLAPFVDFNADGIYDPFQGDYPLIKGDQMLYWIINDNLSVHTETGGVPLGVEVHCSAYSYFCDQLADSEAVMHYTTFYQYRIVNRSPHDYHDFLIGLFSDMDLGNALDDYIGCDTVLNAGFTYNGDNDDSPYGYGMNPPMQNIKILNGPLADAGDGIDNDHDGTIDETGEQCLMSGFMTYNNVNNTPTGNPSLDVNFYSYLNSIWLDGAPLTYGDDGRNVPGPVNYPTKYFYSGTPYDTSAASWNAGNLFGPPNDNRLIVSSGPFSLPAGSAKTIDFAYVFSRDSLAPNGLNTSVAKNKSDLIKVQNWFDANNFPSCIVLNAGDEEIKNNSGEFSIHPNPAKDNIFVTGIRPELPVTYEICDVTGRRIQSGKLKQNVIPVQNFSKGVYFLHIKNASRSSHIKFIKE